MSRVKRGDHLQVKRAKDRRRYKEAKARGACTNCKKHLATPGRTTCQGCRDGRRSYFKSYLSKRRKVMKSLGICTRCLNNRSMPGRVICGRCSEINTENARIREQRKRMALAS